MHSNLSRVAAVIVLGGLVTVVYGMIEWGETVIQPIAFNHALHLDSAGLECADCHTDAATRVYAGLPGKVMCFECHDPDDIGEQAETEDVHPELAKLLPYADSDGDIPWRRIALTAPDVFFSHRRHVAAGELQCLRCHAGQQKLQAPPRTADLVMTMDDCLACHEQSQASLDCLACHR